MAKQAFLIRMIDILPSLILKPADAFAISPTNYEGFEVFGRQIPVQQRTMAEIRGEITIKCRFGGSIVMPQFQA
jgi:hypothetical protein